MTNENAEPLLIANLERASVSIPKSPLSGRRVDRTDLQDARRKTSSALLDRRRRRSQHRLLESRNQPGISNGFESDAELSRSDSSPLFPKLRIPEYFLVDAVDASSVHSDHVTGSPRDRFQSADDATYHSDGEFIAVLASGEASSSTRNSSQQCNCESELSTSVVAQTSFASAVPATPEADSLKTNPESHPHPKKHGLYCKLFNHGHHHARDDSARGSACVSAAPSAPGSPERSAKLDADARSSRTTSIRGRLTSWRDKLFVSHTAQSESDLVDSSTERQSYHHGIIGEKYEFIEKLGKGSSAVVRLARRIGTDEKYAIKKFHWDKHKYETPRDFEKKVTAEFCIGSSLDHENIIKTVDIIHDQNKRWYEVLEYCSGGDMYTMIKKGPMPDEKVNCFFKQLMDGVVYMHSVGVAHRDLKPENLLIDEHGILKITDFGISSVFQTCWESSAHKLSGVCGSTPYMAPEVFFDEEYDVKLVDIWACGIIYYAMQFGGVPWLVPKSADPSYQFFLKRRDLNFEPFSRLPPDCREFLRKVLNPNPGRRLTTGQLQEDRWFRSLRYCDDCRAFKACRNVTTEGLGKA